MSDIITIADEADYLLQFHRGKGIVHHQMKGFLPDKRIEVMLNEGIRTMQEYQASKWLSDDRNGGAVSREHERWAREDWGPRAVEAGWRQWAVVLPESVVGRTSMARLIDTYSELGVTTKVFSSLDQGFAWLRD